LATVAVADDRVGLETTPRMKFLKWFLVILAVLVAIGKTLAHLAEE
jgi:hypothetical protein